MGRFRLIVEWIVSVTPLSDGSERVETGYTISYRRKGGKLHRTNGPARVWKVSQADGAPIDPDTYEFWVNGKNMLRKEFEQHFMIETWEM